MSERSFIKNAAIIIAGIIAFVIILFMSVFTVNTGEVVIIKKFGKVVRIEEEGLHFKWPIVEKKVRMNVREQTLKFGLNQNSDNATNKDSDDSIKKDSDDAPVINASTRDMQSVAVSITVSDIVSDPMKLYKSFTGNHVRSLLIPRIKDSVQSQVAKYTIEEFVAKRDELSNDIYKDLKESFEPYGISLTNVSIVDHDFSDSYEKAVEDKKVAEQAVETEKKKQEQLIVAAESKVKLAELEIAEKEAKAKANKVETESLSQEILTKQMIEKWNGILPYVTGGDGKTILSPEMFSPKKP